MAKKHCDVCTGGITDMFDVFDLVGGDGEVKCDACSGRGTDRDGNTCRSCDGKRKVRCPKCHGTGFIED